MILYRPVSLQELELIYDSGMKAFPARLPQQPIFYPVLDLEYARQIASDWNSKRRESAGYVTQFKVEDDYIGRFEKHTVGSSQHQELWVPADEVEEFNKHISGHIKVVEAHFGKGFEGFVPDKFALQGKNAVEQFTLLANTYVYKRMDFYLELKRNHKAVFLNYPFWQIHDFKNPGLKGKVLQAIKEAWFTSFPQTPLPPPFLADAQPVTKTDSNPLAESFPEESESVERTDPESFVDRVDEGPSLKKQTDAPAQAQHVMESVQEDSTRVEETDSDLWDDSFDEEESFGEETETGPLVKPVDERNTPVETTDLDEPLVDSFDEETPLEEQTDTQPVVNAVEKDTRHVQPKTSQLPVYPVAKETTSLKQTNSHFEQGIKLALSGQVHEAIAELTKAAAEDPEDVGAQVSLGVAFHRLGEDDRALERYETALKLDPIYAEAHYFRANILYSRGKVREAIAGYTMAIGLKPELIEALQNPAPQDRLTDYTATPAEMYRVVKPARRILRLNKLLESNPGQANLFKDRAAEYYRLRNYAQAIADYTSFLAKQPNDASALHLRGVAYEELGQSERASEDYQRAVALDPQLSNVYLNRGVSFGSTGNYQQALASFTEGIRLAPKNPDGYFNRGTAHFQLGDFEAAISDFSRVLQLSPTDEDAYYWRGMSHEAAGRRSEAIADYRQFLAISQNLQARQDIEQKLRQWKQAEQNVVSNQNVVPEDRQITEQAPPETSTQKPDVYDLIVALGERALRSIWFGNGVNCYGEKAEELYTLTDQNRPIEGRDLLRITSGIRQTIAGDFQAFDPGGDSPWIFIRAWNGSGFYIETDDPQTESQLKAHFQGMEEVEGASPPYQSLFIPI